MQLKSIVLYRCSIMYHMYGALLASYKYDKYHTLPGYGMICCHYEELRVPGTLQLAVRCATRSENEPFFFQAEDGIRDSVASRGLGDVYKRQVQYYTLKLHYVH